MHPIEKGDKISQFMTTHIDDVYIMMHFGNDRGKM